MTLYRDDVRGAVLTLTALKEQMIADLDDVRGGIKWWVDHLDAGRRILTGDYLISLTDSTEANLVEAAMHARRVRELWFADTAWMRGKLRDARWTGRVSWERDERATNRLVEADAHLGGFFRAVGSALDNVAGLVVGVAGLRRDIVRSDIRDLRLDRHAPAGCLEDGNPGRAEQVAAADAVRKAAMAGPPDWILWVDDMRNTLVHRARRLSLALHDQETQDVMRPLPRHPAQTETESMVSSEKMAADRLDEHANDTLAGTLRATHGVVSATSGALVQLWQRRRAEPELIRQPAEQWPRLRQGRHASFPGFAPGLMPTYDDGFLVLNSAHGQRLRGALVLDGAGDWKSWLAEPDIRSSRDIG
jgi:hypothetical protein